MSEIPQLVKGCKTGEPRAQRELYERFKAKLMGICRRYTASRDEAQDVLQEAFIKIFSRIAQLDDPEKLEPWMTKITVNTAVNYYHQGKRYHFDDVSQVHIANGDDELIVSGMTDEFLIQQINSLPDGCRVVFNLFIVEGYNHAEIAALLKISESTSRSQLVYAKNILKQKLTSEGCLRYERYA